MWALYDNVAQEFGPIYLAKNEQVAERIAMNQMSQNFAKEDFTFAWLGMFDTDTGNVEKVPQLKHKEIPEIRKATDGI